MSSKSVRRCGDRGRPVRSSQVGRSGMVCAAGSNSAMTSSTKIWRIYFETSCTSSPYCRTVIKSSLVSSVLKCELYFDTISGHTVKIRLSLISLESGSSLSKIKGAFFVGRLLFNFRRRFSDESSIIWQLAVFAFPVFYLWVFTIYLFLFCTIFTLYHSWILLFCCVGQVSSK